MKYEIPKKAMDIVDSLAKLELGQTSFYKRLAQQANKSGFLLAEKYFIAESIEENEHFLGWQTYVNGRGNDFCIPSVEEYDIEAKDLTELIELSLEKEIEVSIAYNEAYSELLSLDVPTAIKAIEYITIQTLAVAIYKDYFSTFSGLDKAGQLVAEHTIFEEN
jgi:hypothetical protein